MLETGVGRIGCVAAVAQDQVACVRTGDDPFDGAAGHPQIQRDERQPRPHRPEVEGRHRRARRGPHQQPIAGLQARRPKPPGDDPAAAVQLAVGPVLGRPVVTAHTEGEPIDVAAFALVDDVEEAVEAIHPPAMVLNAESRACPMRYRHGSDVRRPAAKGTRFRRGSLDSRRQSCSRES